MMLSILLLVLAQTVGDATISGRVTDAQTHQPIAGVSVMCANVRAVTDVNGDYSLHVKSGPNSFFVISKTGYPMLMGMPEKISPGAAVTRDFELTPSAVISGHLLDRDSSKPLPGFTFTAHANGNGSWSGPKSGPDGAFAFTNLKPGDYTIEAVPPSGKRVGAGEPKPEKPDMPEISYGRSWFPGVPREDMALHVTVTAGEKRDLEFRVQKREMHRIAGTIQAPEGTENEPITIRLVAGQRSVQPIVAGEVSKAGAFHIEGLDEGSYTLSATTKVTYASRRIEMTDRDIDDLKLAMRPFVKVRTAVTMAEDKVDAPGDFWLGLRPLLPSTVANLFTHLDDIPPGEYWPVPMRLDSYAVASVSFNGRPVVNTTIDLEGAESTISFVLTSKPSGITGVVRDANQNPVPDARVALLPESLPDNFERFDEQALYVVTSDENGGFHFSRLAPGRYKVVALTGDDTQHDRDLVFLRDRMRSVDGVALDFGQTVNLDLHVK